MSAVGATKGLWLIQSVVGFVSITKWHITGSRDGKVFFIDDDKVMIDGKMYYEESTQNLPKENAYSLFADVLNDWITDLETEDIYILPKLLEKMKDFRVKYFS